MSDPNTADYLRAAERWFGGQAGKLGEAQRRIVASAARRLATTEDPIASSMPKQPSATALPTGSQVSAAHPFIFLNLILSMLAAIQAPVIMMSQNRQAFKDRLMATHDYEVDLKAEIEIMALHEKIDAVRTQQLEALLARQQQQLELLTRLVAKLESQASS